MPHNRSRNSLHHNSPATRPFHRRTLDIRNRKRYQNEEAASVARRRAHEARRRRQLARVAQHSSSHSINGAPHTPLQLTPPVDPSKAVRRRLFLPVRRAKGWSAQFGHAVGSVRASCWALLGVLALAGLAVAAVRDLPDVLWVTTAVASPILLALGFYSVYWATYAWHSPENFERTKFGKTGEGNQFSFSVIVPVRDEIYAVMKATLGCLVAQTHDKVQAVVSVGYDDPDTLAVARQIIAEDDTHRVVLSVSYSDVHNKPTQLNAALRDCTGDIVGILDADSLSAPDLLTQVDGVFQKEGVSVVQGGVIMTNYLTTWVSLRSALEYYVHHRSKMHYSSAHGAILMGGNTVFFKRDLLNRLNGWDVNNLAEDAELSLRLLRDGHTVTVAYEPDLVSREEAPTRVRAWIKQRTRWNLGFLQTIKGGVWRDLPTRGQQRLALWHLVQPTIMSIAGVILPLSILSFFLSNPPLPIAMFTWAPALPTVYTVVVECLMLRAMTREHDTHNARVRDYVKLVLTMPAYQMMLAFASVRASVKYVKGDFGWDKTMHAGDHLAVPQLVVGRSAA